ncbi:MAG TPA: DUF1275 family protein [Rhizobacter sp.]|nr:DUF1275 family protein [Rhizobacter sp.]
MTHEITPATERRQQIDVALLSLVGGFVDTCVFVGLFGLFTAHVTGNLALIGTELVNRNGEVFAKLLSLPVFVSSVVLTVQAAHLLRRAGLKPLPLLLCVEALLLVLALATATRFGPHVRPDDLLPTFAGMLVAAAMAVQNALLRIELSSMPSTTVMTSNVTQALIDTVALAAGHDDDPAHRRRVHRRMAQTWASVFAFTLGAAGGAVGFAWLQFWSLIAPALLCVGLAWRFARR